MLERSEPWEYEQEEFLGCPVCQTLDEDVWEEVMEDDINYFKLDYLLRCSNCGVYQDYAMRTEVFNALLPLVEKAQRKICD